MLILRLNKPTSGSVTVNNIYYMPIQLYGNLGIADNYIAGNVTHQTLTLKANIDVTIPYDTYVERAVLEDNIVVKIQVDTYFKTQTASIPSSVKIIKLQ